MDIGGLGVAANVNDQERNLGWGWGVLKFIKKCFYSLKLTVSGGGVGLTSNKRRLPDVRGIPNHSLGGGKGGGGWTSNKRRLPDVRGIPNHSQRRLPDTGQTSVQWIMQMRISRQGKWCSSKWSKKDICQMSNRCHDLDCGRLLDTLLWPLCNLYMNRVHPEVSICYLYAL